MTSAIKKAEKSYVVFVLAKEGEKTNQWVVLSIHDTVLGHVAWFGRWRQYTFSPQPNTTYSWGCLMEIANFLQGKNQEHRKLGFSA